MTTLPTTRAALIVWCGLVVSGLSAEEPSRDTSPRRVLILQNEAIFQGRIEKLATHYSIRTENGETQIPIAKALRLCENLDEAFEFLRGRANPRDPQERLRLARWCAQYQLWEQARAETDEALRLQPRYLEAQSFQQWLKNQADANPPSAKPQSSAEDKPRFADDNGSALAITPPNPELSYSAETLQVFSQKIQPLLFNSCATSGCHGGNRGGGFDLLRPSGPSQMTSSLTRQNLARTLAWIDRDDPSASPLLRKAVEKHGEAKKAPIPGADAPPYRTLEAWALKTVPGKSKELIAPSAEFASPTELEPIRPTAKEKAPPAANEPMLPPVQTLPPVVSEPKANVPQAPAAVSPPPKNPTKGGEVVADSRPGALPLKESDPPTSPAKPPLQPVDPFDPVIFNQQMHPGRK